MEAERRIHAAFSGAPLLSRLMTSQNRKLIVIAVIVLAAAAALWAGGGALWHMLLVMHGKH